MNKSFNSRKGNKTWMHPPEALLKGHIVYNVKFLGFVDVDSPKGTDVVKDAIRKMKFNKQIKKAEGQKPPKIELTISVDGVTVQEPKSKVIQHKYPLHRMSYCADDKSDKRVFTFIAKEKDSNQHKCFVFDSEKCAEEITLTIGQAFDLAYKNFIEKSTKDVDTRKQYLNLQKKVQQLTQENLQLKSRVADLERCIDPQILDELDKNLQNKEIKQQENSAEPSVGRKLENLVLADDLSNKSKPATQVNGTSASTHASGLPMLTPPPPVPHRNNTPKSAGTFHYGQGDVDVFGQTPFTPASPIAPGMKANPFDAVLEETTQNGDNQNANVDAFGMSSFSPTANNTQQIDNEIKRMDAELMDLQTGFSNGLSFAPDDFSLKDLDPLSSK